MKTSKKILSLVLTLIMLFSVVPVAFAEESVIEFAGGDGTKGNPYQVATAEQLNAVRNNLTAYYIQVADIDMSDWGNWEPIGKAIPLYVSGGNPPRVEESLFSGSYDGDNYVIRNLKITDASVSPHYDCYGLFAGAKNATFSNIKLHNLLIIIDKKSTDYIGIYEDESNVYQVTVGGIVGKASDRDNTVSIINCEVDGSINVRNCCGANAGGIAGSGGNVSKCLNKANINVVANQDARFPDKEDSINNYTYAGGIVGRSSFAPMIQECLNKGNVYVYGDSIELGGIVGSGSEIINCVNLGDLTAAHGVYAIGGIVGKAYNFIENCVNYGSVYADSTLNLVSHRPAAGGIVGDATSEVDLINCYNKANKIDASAVRDYFTTCLIGECGVVDMINCFSIDSDKTTGVLQDHNGFTMLSNNEFLKELTYIGFDFDNIWTIDPDVGGAVLKSYNAEEENIYNLGEETYSFENFSDSDSNGHCFGMSMTSSAYYNNILNMPVDGNVDTFSLEFIEEVIIPICNYQGIQGSIRDASMVAGGSYYINDVYDINSDWQEVINYVKTHEFDGKGTLQIGYRKSGEGGHAINFLRYEVVDGQERIYAYDNNFPDIETYFYKDSNGDIRQAPEETFNGSIDCIVLRDVDKYFNLLEKINRLLELIKRLAVYAEKDMISIKGATAYAMEGNASSGECFMYEIPEDYTKITITPLVDNASFRYMDTEYNFGEINEDTYAELTLSTSEEDNPEFKIINAPEDEPEISDEPCTCKCHGNFIQRLFFKLINFFQKLFGMNKVCACGVKH